MTAMVKILASDYGPSVRLSQLCSDFLLIFLSPLIADPLTFFVSLLTGANPPIFTFASPLIVSSLTFASIYALSAANFSVNAFESKPIKITKQ
jgi:hypothetical protein